MAHPRAASVLARSGPLTAPVPSMLRSSHAGGARRFARPFASSPRAALRQSSPRLKSSERFGSRLGSALRSTKVQWYPIPVGLGVGFLGLVQFYKTQAREKERREQEEAGEPGSRPKKRERTRPEGPW